jgi:hypothetical protein
VLSGWSITIITIGSRTLPWVTRPRRRWPKTCDKPNWLKFNPNSHNVWYRKRGQGKGTLRNGRSVAVIWRETKHWKVKDHQHEADFTAQHQLTEGAEEIFVNFVNGDSRILGAQSLNAILKRRMFAGVE